MFLNTCCMIILLTLLQSEIGPAINLPIPEEIPIHVTNILPSDNGKRSSTTLTYTAKKKKNKHINCLDCIITRYILGKKHFLSEY